MSKEIILPIIDTSGDWNDKTLTELAAQEGELQTEVIDWQQKCLDYSESDKPMDSVRMASYAQAGQTYSLYLKRLEFVQEQRAKYMDKKPLTKLEIDGSKGFSNDAIKLFARSGPGELNNEQKEMFVKEMQPGDPGLAPLIKQNRDGRQYFELPSKLSDMMAANLTGTDLVMAAYRSDSGGNAADSVIDRWDPRVVERLAFLGSMAELCTQFETPTGGEYIFNTLDSSTQKGHRIPNQSSTAITEQNLPDDDAVRFGAYIRATGKMKIRLEAMQDIHWNAEDRIAREGARRLGRGWNEDFTRSDGSNWCEGIMLKALIVDAGAGTLKTLSHANLVDMEYAIDNAYLIGEESFPGGFMDLFMGRVGYMVHRDVEHVLRKAVDPNNRPIWIANNDIGRTVQGMPGMINGKDYALNQDLDPMGTNEKFPAMYGNFGHFCIRNIPLMGFFRFFDSGTIDDLSELFVGFSRRDSRSLGPFNTDGKCEAYTKLQIKT